MKKGRVHFRDGHESQEPGPSTSCKKEQPVKGLKAKFKGKVLCDRFRVDGKLGVGSFGAVYRVADLQEGDEVALKVEDSKIVPESKLQFENEAYKLLQGGPGIPRIRFYGKHTQFQVMAMELIGCSLQGLLVKCSGKFCLKTVLIIADKLLETVEFIHGKLLTHGDLKPDNFLFANGEFYVVDFGLVRRYWDMRNNRHIFYREDKFRRGATAFAPARSHCGFERSRRDDMENIALCLVYFLLGELPWMKLVCKDDDEWTEKAGQLKMSTAPSELCQGLPEEFTTYLEYCRGLLFEEAPDYNYCRQLFSGLFEKLGYENDKVYDWDSPDSVNSVTEEMEALDLNAKSGNEAKDENESRTQPSI